MMLQPRNQTERHLHVKRHPLRTSPALQVARLQRHRDSHTRPRHRGEHLCLQPRPHAALRAAELRAAPRIVQVFSQDSKNPKSFRGFSYPTYRDIREQNTVFSDVLAHNLAMIGIGEKGNTPPRFCGRGERELFLPPRARAGAGPRLFAGRRNARTEHAGRDR